MLSTGRRAVIRLRLVGRHEQGFGHLACEGVPGERCGRMRQPACQNVMR